jgi:hypothetical protein
MCSVWKTVVQELLKRFDVHVRRLLEAVQAVPQLQTKDPLPFRCWITYHHGGARSLALLCYCLIVLAQAGRLAQLGGR